MQPTFWFKKHCFKALFKIHCTAIVGRTECCIQITSAFFSPVADEHLDQPADLCKQEPEFQNRIQVHSAAMLLPLWPTNLNWQKIVTKLSFCFFLSAGNFCICQHRTKPVTQQHRASTPSKRKIYGEIKGKRKKSELHLWGVHRVNWWFLNQEDFSCNVWSWWVWDESCTVEWKRSKIRTGDLIASYQSRQTTLPRLVWPTQPKLDLFACPAHWGTNVRRSWVDRPCPFDPVPNSASKSVPNTRRLSQLTTQITRILQNIYNTRIIQVRPESISSSWTVK